MHSRKCLVLVLLVLLSTTSVLSQTRPRLSFARSGSRLSHVLGVNTTVSVYEFVPSEPLYFPQARFCPASAACASQQCYPGCDFSSPAACQRPSPPATAGGCDCGAATRQLWCAAPLPSYTTLPFDEASWSGPFLTLPTAPTFHRFFAATATPCSSGFTVELEVHSGKVRMFISADNPFPSSPLTPTHNNLQFDSQTNAHLPGFFAESAATAGATANTALMLESDWQYHVCPGSVHFAHGTFAVSVLPVTQSANYSIRVLSTPVVATELDAPLQSPAALAPLTLGHSAPVAYASAQLAQLAVFSLTVDSCRTIVVQLEQHSLGSVLLYTLSTDPAPLSTGQLQSLWTMTQESARPVGVCPPAGAASLTLYINVLALSTGQQPVQYLISAVDTAQLDPAVRSLLPMPSPQSETAVLRLRGAGSVVCDQPDAPDSPLVFECLPGADLFFDTSCQALLPRVPSRFSSVGRPVPPVLRRFDPLRFDVLFFDDPPLPDGERLSFQLFFEVLDSNNRINPVPLTASEFAQRCRFVFPPLSPLVNAAGLIPADESVAAASTNSSVECAYSDWQQLSDVLQRYVRLVFSPDTDERQLYAAKYLYDTATLSRLWTDCQTRLEALMVQSSARIYQGQTTLCLNDPRDPCCSTSVGWSECCHNRDFHITTQVFSAANSTLVENTCRNSACTVGLFDEYVATRIATRQRNVCQVILANVTQEREFNLAFYRLCFDRLYVSASCTSSADCPDDFSCSPRHLRCYPNDVDRQRLAFWRCLADNVRDVFVDDLAAVLTRGTDYSPSAPLEQLLEALAVGDDCISNASVATPFSLQTTPLSDANPACSRCDQECPNTLCDQTLHCSSSSLRTGICSYTPVTSRPAGFYTKCADTLRCNWNTSIQDADACRTPPGRTPGFFCGWCSPDQDHCLEVPGPTDAQQCQQLTLCILPSGAYRTDLTREQCLALQACTVPDCAACTTPEACTAAGACFMPELSFLRSELVNPTGYCTFPMRPFNYFDCASTLATLQWVPSATGCVAYSLCNASGCATAFQTQSECESAGGQWNLIYPSEQGCLQTVSCSEPDVYPLYSPKSDAECRFCVGHVRPVNSWQPGLWRAAEPYALDWQPRQLVRPYQWARTVDFARLEQYIELAQLRFFGAPLAADLQCRYLLQQAQIDRLLCSCYGGSNASQCFRTDPDLQVASQMCKASTFIYIAPPISVFSRPGSFTPDQPSSTCCTITITGLNIHTWTSRSGPAIATFFRVRADTNTNEFAFVVNENRAVVGQGVGNGALIEFPDGVCVQMFYLCLDQTPEAVSSADLASYPVLDFGEPFSADATKVTPLGVAIALTDTGEFCALIRNPRRSQTFVPIIRLEQYQQPAVDYATGGERATLYIVATMYLLPGLLSLGEIVYIVVVSHAYSLRESNNILFIFFLALATIRCVYFYLSASLVFANSQSVVEYVLVELPTFFYVAAGLLLTWNFAFLLIRRQYSKVQKYYWPSFLLSMATLVAFFVGIILALQFAVVDQVDTSSDPNNVCSAIVPAPESQAPLNARIIRLVYQSIIAMLSFTIFIGMGAAGLVVYRKSRAQGYGAQTMLRLVVIASFSILLDTAAFIVYYAVSSPSPYFTIVLIFTEVIPISLLIYLLHRPPPKAESRRRSNRPTLQ